MTRQEIIEETWKRSPLAVMIDDLSFDYRAKLAAVVSYAERDGVPSGMAGFEQFEETAKQVIAEAKAADEKARVDAEAAAITEAENQRTEAERIAQSEEAERLAKEQADAEAQPEVVSEVSQ